MFENNPTKKTYLGNSQLKDTNVKIQWTEHRKQEFIKCAADPIYFITKYIQVFTVDDGIQPFTLWDFQKRLIDTVHDNRFIICKMPRQTGKCVCFQQLTRIRNKKTGEIKEIFIGALYDYLNGNKKHIVPLVSENCK